MAEPAIHELKRTVPGVEIVWRAFELRPEPVPTLDPAGDYLQRVWRDGVYPLAQRLGVKMLLPPVQPRSRLAHEAAHWARERGQFDEYNGAIFRAFFERGEDIGQPDVLVRLAAELSMDGDELRWSLDNHAYRESVLADEREATALGVNAVPAFVANRRAALSGVQTLENLLRLVEHVRDSRPE